MRTATIFLLVLALVACNADKQQSAANNSSTPAQPAAQASMQLTPEQLGELGAQIQRNPDRANELLTHHGLTPRSFEKAIRDVTENPDASKRYAAAYRKASA